MWGHGGECGGRSRERGGELSRSLSGSGLWLVLSLLALLALSEGGELGKAISVCGSGGGEREFAGELGMRVRKKFVMRLDLLRSWADNLMYILCRWFSG